MSPWDRNGAVGRRRRASGFGAAGNSGERRPDLLSVVREMTEGRPEIRPGLDAVARLAATEEFRDVHRRLGPAFRAHMSLSLTDAASLINGGSLCDLCPERATMARLVVSLPGDDRGGFRTPHDGEVVLAIPILCPRCGLLPADVLTGRVLGRMAREQAERGGDPQPYRQTAIMGQLVGAASALPGRATLRECDDCHRTIWIDQDAHDYAGDPDALFLCPECVERRGRDGVIEAVAVDVLPG
jgi:hypothetical protein